MQTFFFLERILRNFHLYRKHLNRLSIIGKILYTSIEFVSGSHSLRVQSEYIKIIVSKLFGYVLTVDICSGRVALVVTRPGCKQTRLSARINFASNLADLNVRYCDEYSAEQYTNWEFRN